MPEIVDDNKNNNNDSKNGANINTNTDTTPQTGLTPDNDSELTQKLAALEQEKQDWYNKYIYKYAEYENIRKKMPAEMDKARQQTRIDLARDILFILDDFELAFKNTADKSLSEGFELRYHKFLKTMQQWGITPMDNQQGQPFNADLHDAVALVPASLPEQANTVIEELQRGYFCGETIIRYAKVVVGQYQS
ncbi:MAG: nucleotide exchange factor GrpE [Sphingobacteriales bacterium]|nr:nucleotide exchange factor GrpE [Sphingobacteriales bacterium]